MRSLMDSKESEVSLVSNDSFEIIKILQVQGMELEVTPPVHARLSTDDLKWRIEYEPNYLAYCSHRRMGR